MSIESSANLNQPAKTLAKLKSKLPSSSALLSLCAIATVVIFVALPSLRSFAMNQNEIDAVRVIEALRQSALESQEHGFGQSEEFVRLHSDLEHRFGDLEYLPELNLMRAHGYLFGLSQEAGEPVFTAWPWAFGRTGRSVFRVAPKGRVLACANAQGLWSGSRPNQTVQSLSNWHELRH